MSVKGELSCCKAGSSGLGKRFRTRLVKDSLDARVLLAVRFGWSSEWRDSAGTATGGGVG